MEIMAMRNVLKYNQDDLIKGEIEKLAVRQVDDIESVSFKGTKENHHVSFRYNKELDRNIAHIIDNATGKTVKKAPSDTQVDHMLRMKKLMGLYVDIEG